MEGIEIQKLVEIKTFLERWLQEHDDNHPAMREQREYYRQTCDILNVARVPEAVIKQPFYSKKLEVCGHCAGEGKMHEATCHTCQGTGKLYKVITGQMELFRTN